jgi:hypothetical protein
MVTLRAGFQIRTLLGFVRERMPFGVIFDLEIGSVFRRMVKSDETRNFKVIALGAHVEERDAVPERVMDPPQSGGLGRNCQVGMEQPLIEAVAGTKHQPMLAQPEGLFVPILCHVTND